MWKFIVDVVHDFVSSLQPDVGRGFLHVSNVFLLTLGLFGQRVILRLKSIVLKLKSIAITLFIQISFGYVSEGLKLISIGSGNGLVLIRHCLKFEPWMT